MKLTTLLNATLIVLSTVWATPSIAREATPEAPRATAEGYISQLAALINDYRARNGLQPLNVAVELAALAGEHTDTMAERRQLSHEGFRERAQRTGSRVCVENVARGYSKPESLLDGWQKSPAHDVNLLDSTVSRMGIAANSRFVTFFACR